MTEIGDPFKIDVIILFVCVNNHNWYAKSLLCWLYLTHNDFTIKTNFYFNSKQKNHLPNSLLSSNFIKNSWTSILSRITLIFTNIGKRFNDSSCTMIFIFLGRILSFIFWSSFCYQIFLSGLSFNSKQNFERNLFASDLIFDFVEMFFRFPLVSM